VAETAAKYGLQHSVGVLHDHTGTLKPLNPDQMRAYTQVTKISPSMVHSLNYWLFQKNLMHGQANDWKCRAGARYLYIAEDGKVHLCCNGAAIPEFRCSNTTRETYAANSIREIMQPDLYAELRAPDEHVRPPPRAQTIRTRPRSPLADHAVW